MTTNCMRHLGIALLFAIGWCSAAKAIPVEVQYTGDINAGDISGQPASGPITVDIFADNGGTSIDNQSWTLANITSTTVTIGSGNSAYVATLSGAFINQFSSINFNTNASGHLTNFYVYDTQYGTDNKDGATTFGVAMGGSPFDSVSFFDYPSYFVDVLSTPSNYLGPTDINTTIISLVSPTPTPLPPALPLFATSLGAMGLLWCCRKQKVQAVAA